MNQQTLEKITTGAVEILVNRANIEITGTYCAKVVTDADIWAAVAADPAGNVAYRLAELITLGVKTYVVVAA